MLTISAVIAPTSLRRASEAQALAGLQIEKAKIDAQRRRAEADVGPVRYLAELIGAAATDLERPVRLLTLALVAVLDPLAVALLFAAGTHTRRMGSRGPFFGCPRSKTRLTGPPRC